MFKNAAWDSQGNHELFYSWDRKLGDWLLYSLSYWLVSVYRRIKTAGEKRLLPLSLHLEILLAVSKHQSLLVVRVLGFRRKKLWETVEQHFCPCSRNQVEDTAHYVLHSSFYGFYISPSMIQNKLLNQLLNFSSSDEECINVLILLLWRAYYYMLVYIIILNFYLLIPFLYCP